MSNGELLQIEPVEITFTCNVLSVRNFYNIFYLIWTFQIRVLFPLFWFGFFFLENSRIEEADLMLLAIEQQIRWLCSLQGIMEMNSNDLFFFFFNFLRLQFCFMFLELFGFQVKTTNPKKYCVRPNTGIVMPRSTCEVTGLYLSHSFRLNKYTLCDLFSSLTIFLVFL